MTYVPGGHYMQAPMMPQLQPMYHPLMHATPQATPQFGNVPLQHARHSWRQSVTPYERSDSGEDDFDTDSELDEPPELEPATAGHFPSMQHLDQFTFPSRSRANSFSGGGRRGHSVPRERHPSLPPAPQNPYQSRFSQLDVRQFLAANAASQHPTPFAPQVALPPAFATLPFGMTSPQVAPQMHIPQPEVVPVHKQKRMKRSKSISLLIDGFKGLSGWDMAPNHEWARYASNYPVMNPAKLRPGSIKLHPLLSRESCRQLLNFNAVRPPATLNGEASLQECIHEPATAPPVNQLHLWTGVHPKILSITNPSGVTVGNVLGVLGDHLFQKLPKTAWKGYPKQRQEEIGDWFWHNRKHGAMPPVEKGVMYADLLGPATFFGGLESVVQNGIPLGTFAVQWDQPAPQFGYSM